jgi:hypothetical protein
MRHAFDKRVFAKIHRVKVSELTHCTVQVKAQLLCFPLIPSAAEHSTYRWARLKCLFALVFLKVILFGKASNNTR